MPLSEHEQRLLDQIERALYAEDPKFATTVRSTDLRTHMKRRLRRAVALVGVGFVLLVAGVVTNVALGIAGFVVMLGGLMLALSAWTRLNGGGSARGAARAPQPAKRKKAHGSARERLEERWKRRWEERGGPQ